MVSFVIIYMLPRGYSHLRVHDSFQIGLRQFIAFLSESSLNNRFDFLDLRCQNPANSHGNALTEEHVQVLHGDFPAVFAIHPT